MERISEVAKSNHQPIPSIHCRNCRIVGSLGLEETSEDRAEMWRSERSVGSCGLRCGDEKGLWFGRADTGSVLQGSSQSAAAWLWGGVAGGVVVGCCSGCCHSSQLKSCMSEADRRNDKEIAAKSACFRPKAAVLCSAFGPGLPGSFVAQRDIAALPVPRNTPSPSAGGEQPWVSAPPLPPSLGCSCAVLPSS